MKLRPPPSLLEHREHEGPWARARRADEPLPMTKERIEGLQSAPPSPQLPTGQAGLLAPTVVPDRPGREAIARAAAEAAGGVPGAQASPPGTTVGDRHPHFRPGFVFSVISEGYGLMPSYAPELSVTDRWAVVAYLEALRLSQRARVSALPPELAERVRAEASR
ncbi:MAG: cytochrome c [Myxococcaceae bacterium]|nr:cytochrome c [Myxococcaceae bacterium]